MSTPEQTETATPLKNVPGINELVPGTDEYLGESEERLNDMSKDPPSAHRDRAMRQCGGTCCGCGSVHHSLDGGSAIMHIHHRRQDPPHVPYHHFLNLTWYCARCHRWQHQAPNTPDLAPDLQELVGGADLQYTWIQILSILSQYGPSTVAEIESKVDLKSGEGARFALYSLIALDKRQPTVSRQIVAKDYILGLYGLAWQIPEVRHTRGTVPENPTVRRQRVRDEVTNRLDQQLADRDGRRRAIADAVGRSRKQTRIMQRRAQAFQFPLDQWLTGPWYRGRKEPLDVFVDILKPDGKEEAGVETTRRVMLLAETIDESLIDQLAHRL